MHSVCTDIPQSLEEFERQVDMCMKTGVDFGVNYEVIFRATEDFYEENKEWMHETAKKIGKPLLLELLPERKHYWVSKMDFAAIDYLGRPIENPTVQIDVESGKRFGIEYLCEDETEEHPIILHCSPTGSIERVICSLLEKTAIELNEKQPMLPSWMSPTQVRILPITENHLDFALELSDKIKEANIRVDVDDRQERIGKKIRNAGKDWIPFVVVIGDNEVNGDKITVNVRSTKEKVEMSVEDLITMVKVESEGMPYRPLPLPRELSKRINF
jgi:threonyl-tRNA synthetase